MNESGPEPLKDDPFRRIGRFYMMEHDAIHHILEERGIAYEIAFIDRTQQTGRGRNFGLKVQFDLFIHRDSMKEARILLERFLPKV
ncbi:MAG: hypothetical protein SFU85_06255 [Candidatus Methylacidiphilales bacterium]|nr:hypothetical protein [Candidatus Methylacidiphilales bacterium]